MTRYLPLPLPLLALIARWIKNALPLAAPRPPLAPPLPPLAGAGLPALSEAVFSHVLPLILLSTDAATSEATIRSLAS